MKDSRNTLETRGNGSGRVGSSPRLLRRATLSGRGFKGGWLELGAGGLYCDLFADGVEVVHHVVVFETDHAHTELLEGGGTGSVSSQSFWGVMLRTIEFDDQFERRAVEIWNVLPNRSLPQPTHGLVVQKLIPKFALRRSQRPPQLLRERRQPFVIRQPSHQLILTHSHPKTPSQRGSHRASGRGEHPARPLPSHPSNLEVNHEHPLLLAHRTPTRPTRADP